MSTFTAAKNLELVARGADVGTWDTPTNSNWSIVDASLGGLATIALTNTNVTLNSGQYQSAFIRFTGTLTGNVSITFPAVGSFYKIDNQCVGAFTITLQTTVAASQVIGCPPGESFDIWTDGSNVKYSNFGRIGTPVELPVTSTPAWISACTVPPYLYCNGTTFSSAVYPALRDMLGTNTLPTTPGRTRFAYNDGTGTITSSGGIDGNTRGATGGVQQFTIAQTNLPNVNFTVSGQHQHSPLQDGQSDANGTSFLLTVPGDRATFGLGAGGIPGGLGSLTANSGSGANITVASGGSGTPKASLNPGYVWGMVFMRAG